MFFLASWFLVYGTAVIWGTPSLEAVPVSFVITVLAWLLGWLIVMPEEGQADDR